jgi:hypothetical protein
VEVRRDEIAVFEGTISLAGTLTTPAGEPVAGAKILFWPLHVAGIPREQKRNIIVTTDAEGRFAAGGFKPGRWWVNGELSDGGEPRFDDLVIPDDPDDPFVHHMVLPGGRITATMHDKVTGRPLGDDEPMWWVFLQDTQTMKMTSELNGGHCGPRFTLVGIPPGEYVATVSVNGYLQHVTRPITLAAGENKDLGRILLEPSAVLELEVKDLSGNPVSVFQALLDNEVLTGRRRKEVGEGHYRYFNLSPGEYTVEVTAAGYAKETRTIDLAPGGPTLVRITLAPE